MGKRPVLVIADDERPYRALTLPDELMELVPFEKGFDPVHGLTADIILLDSNDEIEKGLELLKGIKTAASAVPVIFIAGACPEGHIVRAFRLGARDYFRKPFNHSELCNTIEKLLEIKRSSERRRTPCFMPDEPFQSKHPEPVVSFKRNTIYHVISYIQNNLSKDLPLAILAREAHLSKYHFCRTFKKYVGMSPRQFILHLRLERAKSLLVKEDFNISLAAIEAGFNDLSNFNKEFKRHIGVTPTTYRNTRRFKTQPRIPFLH